MKLNIDRKILLGFALSCLILVFVGIISLINNSKANEDRTWVNHTQEVLYNFRRVATNVADAESGMRGFVITGDQGFLETYTQASNKLPLIIDTLQSLVADNPAQKARVDSIVPHINAVMKFYEECIAARETSGLEGGIVLVKTGRGKSHTDAIRKLLNEADASENALLARRSETSNNSSSRFTTMFLLLLGIILVIMTAVYFIITANLRALRKAEAATAAKNWMLAGAAEVERVLQGNLMPAQIAEVAVGALAKYMRLPAGVCYVTQNTGAELQGMGGYSVNGEVGKTFRFGEGLPGQCAKERRLVEVSGLPEGFLPVKSAMGTGATTSALLVPLIAENTVQGVLEYGKFGAFTAEEKQLLDSVSGSIALALLAAGEREMKSSLLEETQRQAEELEAQQEELRRSNEELIDKTQLLEASEEELRTQQEELQQNNEELEEKADQLQAQKEYMENIQVELERKARELEMTSKYKSEFLANMSHELRTPLNSILILSQLLSENKYKGLSEKEQEFARNINGSGNDLLRLINEILDLSKVEAGKIQLDIHNVRFEEIAENLEVMFSEQARHKGVDFAINLAPELKGKTLSTDQMRVEQVVRNLLSNAFKFTERKGKVRLKIGKKPSTARLKRTALNTSEDVVFFSVTDTGIGIPSDKFGIIFEAFQQADGSTKRKYGGTGLGLSICRELSNLLHGEIQVESEEGHGSTFTFYLPLNYSHDAQPVLPVVQAQKAAAPAYSTAMENIPELQQVSDDRDHISENDRLILIIEDDPTFANVLLDFVRERKYKGVIAHQGNTGLSYARAYKPDAIMLDINIPVIDGTDVLKLLKSDPLLRHIPVQIISFHDRKKETMALGAFSFTRKPVAVSDLQHMLTKVEEFSLRGLKKLLVVEDNELQNRAVCELIGNGDVKCYSAYSAAEAHRMLLRENFDCLIVDLGLPDISGYEFLEKIKANAQLSQIPVIVYTGRELGKEERDTLMKLADTVVLKTADSNERLFDEAALFLHRVESRLPKEKQMIIRKLHKASDVLRNKTVLVVDDDMRNIYSLVSVLEDEGVNCITAENGKIALAELAANPGIELVLMDVMMPEMDGYETTREIRNNPKYAQLPVIALTAKAMKGDREKCIAAGMSDYISKPVNVAQLLSLMRIWLYSSRSKSTG